MVRHFLQILLLVPLLALPSCQRQPAETLHLQGETMGTTWSVSLVPGSVAVDAGRLQGQLQGCLDRINRRMSSYDPASEVSRFNALTSSDWFPTSAETFQVIALSQQISRLSGGTFDISVGPLVELWGFGPSPRGEHIPADEKVQKLLAQVGFEKLSLRQSPPAIRKQVPQLQIDLSAVAKGYAVDALAALLIEQGIDDFLVEIGGELLGSGHRADGMPWRVAIENLEEGVWEILTVFPLSGMALATSGNYRNFYVEDGQRYAHTIDPLSGRPVRHKLASVSVFDPLCARADALATALMVMGEERGRVFCEQNRIAALFLVHDGEGIVRFASPALQALQLKVAP